MNLKIRNIGLVNNANIKFGGLTVIAGENDTGKSTVGKTMFAIIKAFSKSSEDIAHATKRTMFNYLDNIYFKIRKAFSESDENLRTLFLNSYFPPAFLKEIDAHLELGDYEGVNKLLDEKLEFLNHAVIQEEDMEDIVREFERLRSSIFPNKKEYVRKSLQLSFMSEFSSEISSKLTSEESVIIIDEGSSKILDIELNNNKITKLERFDELFFTDVTYIESPLMLQMYDIISKADAFLDEQELVGIKRPVLRRQKVPYHMKDLVSKMESAQYFNNLDIISFDENLLESVSNIINGEVSFKKEKRDFVFSKYVQGKSIDIKPINLATGIKAFGVLQLLIKAGIVRERSLLIIDEPEIHLHPKWQVEYCKLIVELVKNGIPVLVNSHSPYIIQALSVFSQQGGLENKTSFYLSECIENGNSTNIEDVTNDLKRVFVKLSEPLQKLVWEN